MALCCIFRREEIYLEEPHGFSHYNHCIVFWILLFQIELYTMIIVTSFQFCTASCSVLAGIIISSTKDNAIPLRDRSQNIALTCRSKIWKSNGYFKNWYCPRCVTKDVYFLLSWFSKIRFSNQLYWIFLLFADDPTDPQWAVMANGL